MGRRRFVLAFDPSGAFNEGDGTTGWCLWNVDAQRVTACGCLHAHKYQSQNDYWEAHLKIIDTAMLYDPEFVIEDYFIYRQQADQHINSRLETSQLIGILKQHLFKKGIEANMQSASEVVKRWSNDILEHKGYIKRINRRWCVPSKNNLFINIHQIDAIRHAVHYATFKMEKSHGRRKDLSKD